MKKLINTSFALLFCSFAWTQEYTPFNFENGVWIYTESGMDGTTYTQYFCKGDTMINEVKYYKLYKYGITYPSLGPVDTFPIRLHRCIRNNDTKQVVMINPNDLENEILYDFNLKIGDTIKFNFTTAGYNPIVKRVDSIFLCGKYHKEYITQHQLLFSSDSLTLIEGVGMNQCLFGAPVIKGIGVGEFNSSGCYTEIGNNSDSECALLLNVKNNQNLKEEIKIFPNPSNSKLTINSPAIVRSLYISDMFGRMCYSDNRTNGRILKIDTMLFKAGYYLLHLEFRDNTITTKSFVVTAN
jgi:hypothetical protein